MKRNLITRRTGPLLMLRQGTEDPTDAEWAECIVELEKLLATTKAETLLVKVLVFTEGGAPTARQRGTLQKSLAQNQICVAVVTNDTKARITSSTVALANRNQRSFSTAEWSQACEYLGLSPEQTRAARRALDAMAIDLG